jgi:uncharacterized Zn-finger protein
MPSIPPEIIEVDSHTETIGCDGGDGALGHPKTYYSFGPHEKVICGYCDREFVKAGSEAAASAKANHPDIYRASDV